MLRLRNVEVVRAPEAGELLADTTPSSIAAGVRALFAAPPDCYATRRYAELFGWEQTSAGKLVLFQDVVARHGRPPPPRERAGPSRGRP